MSPQYSPKNEHSAFNLLGWQKISFFVLLFLLLLLLLLPLTYESTCSLRARIFGTAYMNSLFIALVLMLFDCNKKGCEETVIPTVGMWNQLLLVPTDFNTQT
eukprot:TRINITY_DN13803_c0_g1_i1.p1 TRINITY_DN13803_c0_g1~~TRINITY_DN13803_c0_g1_i1.p1  ORF type:complete len:102 (+),score=11.42 TRINITY_DN13803_c0_g1_i1:126-431(+)